MERSCAEALGPGEGHAGLVAVLAIAIAEATARSCPGTGACAPAASGTNPGSCHARRAAGGIGRQPSPWWRSATFSRTLSPSSSRPRRYAAGCSSMGVCSRSLGVLRRPGPESGVGQPRGNPRPAPPGARCTGGNPNELCLHVASADVLRGRAALGWSAGARGRLGLSA